MDSSNNLIPGMKVTVTWEANPRGTVKSNKLNGQTTSKIVLPSPATRGPTLKPAETWECTVEKITNPNSDKHGAIIVVPLQKKFDGGDFGDVWVEDGKMEIILAVLQDPTMNLYLQGLQGVGKTTIAEEAAHQLGKEFRLVDGASMKKVGTMFGRPQQSVTAEGQLIWGFADTPVITAVREAIANPDIEFLLFLDEISRMDGDANDSFLTALAGKHRAFTTPKPEIVAIPPNVTWIGAGNDGDSFRLQQSDAASMDRWLVLEINRMPYDVELPHLLRKFPHYSRAELEPILKIVHQLIEIITTRMRLTNTISVRQTENMTNLLSRGINKRSAMVTAIANQFRGRGNDPTSERGRLIATIDEALDGVDITA